MIWQRKLKRGTGMSQGIFIIGTDTEVGKTVVCAGLMHLLLQKGQNAAYFKPVASGEVVLNGASVPGDAAFVCAASGFQENMKTITPFSFADSVAPHLAARLAGRRIERDVIHKNLEVLKSRHDMILGEAAGGLAVPLDDDGWMQYDLIRDLNFPCLLVARAGLGTINHTFLTLRFAEGVGLKVKGIIVNRAGDTLIERDNIQMVRKLSGKRPVFTVPDILAVDTEKLQAGNLAAVFEQCLAMEDLLALMETL